MSVFVQGIKNAQKGQAFQKKLQKLDNDLQVPISVKEIQDQQRHSVCQAGLPVTVTVQTIMKRSKTF